MFLILNFIFQSFLVIYFIYLQIFVNLFDEYQIHSVTENVNKHKMGGFLWNVSI